jgi:poly(ADP-ribose) glycohydrolase ARH3
MSPTWVERATGSLLGTACGDALGAPFEGFPTVVPEAIDRWCGDGRPLVWTDDTALALTLAEHLVAHDRTVDQDVLAADFARTWAGEPHRGYGVGAVSVFRQIELGVAWQVAAGELFGGHGSFGNGGAMRVAPVAFPAGAAAPLADVAELARRSAAVTHTHPLAQDGACAQALAVALAARSEPAVTLDVDEFVATIASHVESSELGDRLRTVAGLCRDRAAPEEIATAVGHGITALEAVPAALAAFLRHPEEPAEAITFAVRIGGDTDTIAAMAGAIAGARCGEQGLPPAWSRRLEAAAYIEQLATRLAAPA